MDNELKRCPFCGGEAYYCITDVDGNEYGKVVCSKCGAQVAISDFASVDIKRDAYKKWNRRSDGWISDRRPTEDDADENGNVLVWNGKCSVLAYYKAAICRGNSWQPLPQPPKKGE